MADEHFFYISPNNLTKNRFTLDAEEAHHASNVLRLKVDDEIWLLDGLGTAYKGIIKQNGQEVSGEIISEFPDYSEANVKMHIAVGLIKRDRFEWLLEKAVECGAVSITPLLLDRCVKKSLNIVRSQKIVKTAAKQCGRSRFPIVHEPNSLIQFINNNIEHIICLNSHGEQSLVSWQKNVQSNKVSILIGPEGDFSENEMTVIKEKNIPIVTLGSRRLRTETAAITALNIIEFGGLNE
ncbi:MAG: RsmE family RNA methyltransferase [Candidatus Marinimicrobia bacterium]|jgi:16S rRNA (uracil1498-N3)-methyltransferase|nr:RsmE family RNA methyltransferase [Candidatus Neomarinimicrobiota bacterium]MDP7165505.1 RsmE family RNA methyltransferase [Candidatus Neomarinimicrobiota bacterium]|tara:strand:+ start:698 stop:1411 length:714 start_codon:yes stop_codon:yes gene_type:complete